MRKLCLFLVVLMLAPAVWAETVEEEVARYQRIFNADRSSHSLALDAFAYIGVSDTRIFDKIEALLLEDANVFRSQRDEKNRVARYIRALGFSGQPKYLPTIQRFINDRDYDRYAKAASEDLPNYQRWNPIISNRASFDSKLSDDANRVMNMLKSKDLMLKRVAAKRIYFANNEPVLLQVLADDLRVLYPTVRSGDDPVDAVAWMVKAIGNAKQEAYRPLLQEVLLSAPSDKVRSYAKRALEHY
ncbi:MAG TPA: hypothetical protein PLW86_18785 [Rhodocyclaceae bacterium]|nr:hypothetical protein [Rhodocyclaceae bacterium]